MTTLFDTSVLVQALVRGLDRHAQARQWLDRAIGGEFPWVVGAHTLAELYAVLTALPVSPRIAPAEARQLIHDNIERSATVVALTAREYSQTLAAMAQAGVTGGAVYDALICKAAHKANVRRLLTFNTSHFQRIWPVIAPDTPVGQVVQTP